jgi:hypothetical protein
MPPPIAAAFLRIRHAEPMTLLHCPLCISLAILSVLRAMSHLTLATVRLAPRP